MNYSLFFRANSPFLQFFCFVFLILILTFLEFLIPVIEIPIMPSSIFKLSSEWYKAFALTSLATFCVYFLSLVIGHLAGGLAGVLYLASKKSSILKAFPVLITFFYQFVYVIPFSITIVISYSAFYLVFDIFWEGVNPQGLFVGLFMLLVGATVLPGYRVFRAIYLAVSQAKEDNLHLVLSLYTPGKQEFLKKIKQVFRLRDFEIAQYHESLTDAFNLSLISVVITEMVLTNFYENFFPRVEYEIFLGGIGRMGLNAQQALSWNLIFGILWLLILLNWGTTKLIEWLNLILRGRHYLDSPELKV